MYYFDPDKRKKSSNRNRIQILERKFSRYAIRNLMLYLVVTMGVVLLADFFLAPSGVYIEPLLSFDKTAIAHGEVWRLFTFIILPHGSGLLFTAITLYFYWMVGSSLQNEWGSFRFNIYYLCGFLGAILSGLLTGYATNIYLNMSLFLAFAIVFPNYQIMLFFILPIKVKYLAIVYALYIAWELLYTPFGWTGRVAVLFSLLNVALFFGADLKGRAYQLYRRLKWKSNFK